MKPLLFLDVDGVLNILPGVLKAKKAPPTGFHEARVDLRNGDLRTVLINEEIGEGLRSLSDDVEIRWVSHWNSRANLLGKMLGLPRCTFVAISPWMGGSKAPTIFYEIGTRSPKRPAIWVDDECTSDDVFQMQIRISSPFSALRTDPAVGLRLQDIELIRSEFALLG
ncbi:hypothetical protein [Terracoccus sp. 273MFTsu3.1]|uniref:hypothetical protein n=1 Tax=Terracoccus sp. 273MFTsu3.1 TaxID=1172188 RepID=UPI00036C9422|nr:hypothetical protein [Terracoccus sp. 273MFTsu3.1]